MPFIELPTLMFACWTLAYHLTLATRLPGMYAYWAFILLVVPAVVLYARRLAGRGLDVPCTTSIDRLACLGVLAMGALVAYLTMLVSRPDWDDLGFFHRAVIQYGHMYAPFSRMDTMHNLPGMAYISPVHLLTSYEMASAFAAKLLQMDPVVFYHNITCAALSSLVPVVYFLLFRETGLDGPKAAAASFGATAFLWYDGNIHHSFGNMSFVRLYQGKAVFFALLMPTMFLFGVRYIKEPGIGRWAMLFLACVCGVGLTSSALFMVPLFLFVFSSAHIMGRVVQKDPDKRGLLKDFFVLNLAGIYCIILMLLFIGATGYYLRLGEEESAWWVSVQDVLGGGWSLAWYCLLLLAVPWFALERRWSWFWGLYILGLILVFFNPLTGPLWAKTVNVYSRFVYLLPLPFCAGLGAALLASLFGRARGRQNFRAAYAILALLIFFGAMAYRKPTFSKLNYVFYKAPLDYKLDVPVLDFCKGALGGLSGRNLLAPEEVAVVAPLLDGTLRLEAARELYTAEQFTSAGDKAEGIRRVRAQLFVEDGPRSPGAAAAFDASIRNGVDAVVTRSGLAPVVLRELSGLPGVWKLAYQDNNFALLLKG